MCGGRLPLSRLTGSIPVVALSLYPPLFVWQVPLEDESVDVAVFCLALMGTNLREILEEANRVLRLG